MAFRIVSYFTKGTIYETIMYNYLLPCLEFLAISHFVCEVKDARKWETNASFQPEIILRAMKTFKDENIVWIDADAIVLDYPKIFDDIPPRCDIGLYYLKYEDHWGGVPPGVDMPKPVLNTGVIYFHNTPKMRDFVLEWADRCSAERNKGHREHLKELIDERLADELSFFLLPRGYAYIAEREDGLRPAVLLPHPVILQFQASLKGRKDLYDITPFMGGNP